MRLFKKKKNNKCVTFEPIVTVEEKVPKVERPRVCCIDLSDETVNSLINIGINVIRGTLGDKIKVPNNTRTESHRLLLNYNFPLNLHEFDIIILDLENFKVIDYKPEENIKTTHTGKSSTSLLSSYPETLFDPRPISSRFLRDHLIEIINRPYLVIAFSTKGYNVSYEFIEIKKGGYEKQREANDYNIYSFWDFIPLRENKYGTEFVINKMRDDLKGLLEKYIKGVVYSQTFNHPRIRENGNYVNDNHYFPLITNKNEEIISYMESVNNKNLIMFPQIKDKTNFLLDFLSKVAPSIFPELFPYSTTFVWKNQEEYWLPNYSILLEEKTKIINEYENKIEIAENKIKENSEAFKFLHEIITETGANLVNALIKFFKWLEFEEVKDYDKTNSVSDILEEDIQVNLSNGLLIIECKGIGGTSSDSDCSQISKIKHRRCEERGKFDVYALYIVNHQRYLPPLKRQNPPFTEMQIKDAKNDKRGLLSSWQLFNLYFDIENGIISKEEARKLLLNFGFIEFRPANLHFLFRPTEIFNKGTVCIINLENYTIKVGDELLIEKNEKFTKATIVEIQENDKPISSASSGEIGIKLNSKIKKNSMLWIRKNP